MRLPSEITHL